MKDIRQSHRVNSIDEHVKIVLTKIDRPDLMPSEIDEKFGLVCRLNYGNWIVDCPFCPGAEPLDFANPKFFCLSCFNASNGGKWIPVVTPDPEQRLNIEGPLEALPKPFQNWGQR